MRGAGLGPHALKLTPRAVHRDSNRSATRSSRREPSKPCGSHSETSAVRFHSSANPLDHLRLERRVVPLSETEAFADSARYFPRDGAPRAGTARVQRINNDVAVRRLERKSCQFLGVAGEHGASVA